MLKNEKSANRNDHQNRKTEVFCNKNRKTDLKNSQNRKSQCPPLKDPVYAFSFLVSKRKTPKVEQKNLLTKEGWFGHPEESRSCRILGVVGTIVSDFGLFSIICLISLSHDQVGATRNGCFCRLGWLMLGYCLLSFSRPLAKEAFQVTKRQNDDLLYITYLKCTLYPAIL